LPLRVEAQQVAALALAQGLAVDVRAGRVLAVSYPGLPEHPDHAIAREYMDSFGFMLTIEIGGGLSGAVRVYDKFSVIARAVSLGGVESLASLPLHTSHAMMSAAERHSLGIADGLIRISVGIEPYAALVADIANALDTSHPQLESVPTRAAT